MINFPFGGDQFEVASAVEGALYAGASAVTVMACDPFCLDMACAVAHAKQAKVYAHLSLPIQFGVNWRILAGMPDFPRDDNQDCMQREYLWQIQCRAIDVASKSKVDGVLIPSQCDQELILAAVRAFAGREVIVLRNLHCVGDSTGLDVYPTPKCILDEYGATAIILDALPRYRYPKEYFLRALAQIQSS
jgi:hypothetical protein